MEGNIRHISLSRAICLLLLHAICLPAFLSQCACADATTLPRRNVRTPKPLLRTRGAGRTPRSAPLSLAMEHRLVNCASTCTLRVCTADDDDVVLSMPGQAVSAPLCRLEGSPIVVRETAEARVYLTPLWSVPLSMLGRRGPLQTRQVNFPRNAVGVFPLRNVDGPTRSGIGFGALNAAQRGALDGLCVTLPITSYEYTEEEKDGRVVSKTAKRKSSTECVSMRVIRPKLDIRVRWEGQDDYDLEVFEPDNNLLYYGKASNIGGHYVADDHHGDCDDNDKSGYESITYRAGRSFRDGIYVIRVRRFLRCSPPLVKVPLTIIVLRDGREWFRNYVVPTDEERDGLVLSATTRMVFENNGTKFSYAVGDAARD